MGANWRKIKPDEKAYYEALAVKDKRRYALDLLKAKQQEEEEASGEHMEVNQVNRAISPFGDSDTSGVSDSATSPIVKNAAVTPAGVDPSSVSYQVMLRQSLNANTMNESDFLNTQNPHMIAQMALLSTMMIDYVQKVAPERLENAQLPPGSFQSHLSPDTPLTTNNNGSFQGPPGAFFSGNELANNWAI